MRDGLIEAGGATLYWREDGAPEGAPLVLAHALGLDHTLWDAVVPLLPPELRIIRYDLRGHGRSSVPPAPYGMGALVRDAEGLMDGLGLRDAIFLGLSIGGMVAQGLAVKRFDLVRGLILSNTAARIGGPNVWERRMATVRQSGLSAVADETMARWFSRAFRDDGLDLPWRAKLLATPVEGYLGCCAALAGADFYTTTASLTLPTLAVAGTEDGSTPPDLVRETADLVRGSEFALIRGAGHLPPVDRPAAYAALIATFAARIAHAGPREPQTRKHSHHDHDHDHEDAHGQSGRQGQREG
ncbi:3-oxoadipate enol-lactonase [Haematobacter massiliensis]|uniref:3-oxoadipate enol-lactonase n=1 Tax=Haematobacter massiliensis TaxID=195105 RepID=UPI0023F25745|nr:3-oxoadipate enol-lactonase [Haematobacter massiliensis]